MHSQAETALRLSGALELKAEADSKGLIAGIASPFGGEPDSYGDLVAAGAFAASLARHRKAGTSPALLWSHDPSKPIGRWDGIEEGTDGLRVRGVLNLKTEAGREAFEHVRGGSATGLSIGYLTKKASYKNGARVLEEIDLREISLVAMAAAPAARVREFKTLGSRAELRDLLHDAGLPRGAAEKLASGGWPALAGVSPEDEARAALLAEVKAVAALFPKGLNHGR